MREILTVVAVITAGVCFLAFCPRSIEEEWKANDKKQKEYMKQLWEKFESQKNAALKVTK